MVKHGTVATSLVILSKGVLQRTAFGLKHLLSDTGVDLFLCSEWAGFCALAVQPLEYFSGHHN